LFAQHKWSILNEMLIDIHTIFQAFPYSIEVIRMHAN
jgi:hypothetical protein